MAVTEQRERNAAKAKVDKRREEASGAAGWVAERAGEWSLEGVDDSFMDKQKYLWNPLSPNLRSGCLGRVAGRRRPRRW
jgi:hypothetical protein